MNLIEVEAIGKQMTGTRCEEDESVGKLFENINKLVVRYAFITILTQCFYAVNKLLILSFHELGQQVD